MVALLQGGVLLPGELEGSVRVELQKKGEVTELRKYGYTLGISADGSGRAADFVKPSPPRWQDGVFVRNASRPKSRPQDAVVLLAERTANGTIAFENSVTGDPGSPQVPKELRLVATGNDSGFMRYKPADRQLWSREMRQAPDRGYQRELVISGREIANKGSRGPIYFYCRIGGKYGKGFIGSVGGPKDGSAVTLDVMFLLQPDESRNLETGNDYE